MRIVELITTEQPSQILIPRAQEHFIKELNLVNSSNYVLDVTGGVESVVVTYEDRDIHARTCNLLKGSCSCRQKVAIIYVKYVRINTSYIF